MNTVTAVRKGLRELLTDAGITAHHFLPERPQPPLALVVPGEPYVDKGPTFGHHTFRLDVLMLTRTATNETVSDELDEMVARVTVAVTDSDDYVLQGVDAPNSFQVNNATYLGAIAHVSADAVVEVTDRG